ncbi:Fur family transcriptional regulator [Oceanithermus sp.]|uniref:Fur family transcriptional regulator n=1 Tax=Oceanithermus sp. TaxID=2268145 RepID=UPI0025CFFAE0|nr:Fur family transcriptional regulator [Oceanithermus sp.]
MDTDALERRMTARGLRRTPQRLAVWRAFAERPGRTIREVAAQLHEQGIGQATVYRAVRALEDAGLLLRFAAPHGEVRFAAVLGHAHLLVCERCGAVEPLEECHLGAYEAEVARRSDYLVSGHTLIVYGVCPHCREGA